ncbi:MAG: hypothetical protein SFV24_07960 [Gemmatimonadales bacterium]|nr:hypothetical protein [Gemmatimonadales bacterium]
MAWGTLGHDVLPAPGLSALQLDAELEGKGDVHPDGAGRLPLTRE